MLPTRDNIYWAELALRDEDFDHPETKPTLRSTSEQVARILMRHLPGIPFQCETRFFINGKARVSVHFPYCSLTEGEVVLLRLAFGVFGKTETVAFPWQPENVFTYQC